MAQKTRAQLQSQIDSLLADNTAGNITSTDVRTVDGDNIDSNLNLQSTGITEVEAGYLANVSSSIQTQIDSKLALAGGAMTGAITGNVAVTGFRPLLTESTIARTLALTDAGNFISTENASPTTVTVPLNASVAFPIGTEIDFIQKGAGVLTITAALGATLNVATSVVVTAQWGGVTIKKIGTDEWIAVGKI